jgi:hypothetical protein
MMTGRAVHTAVFCKLSHVSMVLTSQAFIDSSRIFAAHLSAPFHWFKMKQHQTTLKVPATVNGALWVSHIGSNTGETS